MGARVIVIGLDAAEATLLERWAASGDFPTFAALARRGAVARLANPMETLPGAIWPELMTGRSAGKLPLYYHPSQLHTGDAETRQVTEDELDASEVFWAVASDAGRRVAVVDVPQAPLAPRLNGVQLLEWGNHDRTFTTRSDPPELLEEVRARWGDHPVESCDTFGDRLDQRDALRVALARGVECKSEMLLDLLARDDWDLFVGTFTESHCAGHQFWQFFDPSSPHDAPEALRRTIFDTYGLIDAGLGALLDAAGPETTVLVVASHGMGAYTGGPQLCSELLVRLGMVGGARLRRRVPPMLRAAFRHRLPKAAKQVARASGLHSPATRAVSLQNNRCGAVRLNLAGREPVGRVQPGPEADAVLDEITTELRALRQPASGEPVVKQVFRADEAFGPDHHPDVPDLLVAFRTDLGPLDDCESPRAGHIQIPITQPWITRTGDHSVESRLWAVGPGIAPGSRLGGGNVLDLAPTVLSLLGIAPPDDLDGRPLLTPHVA